VSYKTFLFIVEQNRLVLDVNRRHYLSQEISLNIYSRAIKEVVLTTQYLLHSVKVKWSGIRQSKI
jgi:hypothetical protein